METQIEIESSPVYNKKDWKVWWRLTRPHTLTAAFVPVTFRNRTFYEYLFQHSILAFLLLCSSQVF